LRRIPFSPLSYAPAWPGEKPDTCFRSLSVRKPCPAEEDRPGKVRSRSYRSLPSHPTFFRCCFFFFFPSSFTKGEQFPLISAHCRAVSEAGVCPRSGHGSRVVIGRATRKVERRLLDGDATRRIRSVVSHGSETVRTMTEASFARRQVSRGRRPAGQGALPFPPVSPFAPPFYWTPPVLMV
jgi:hypothetical protein